LIKSETGNLKIQLSKQDPTLLLKEVAEDVSTMVNKKNQQFIVDIPEMLPQFMFDRERIYQVLLNLLDNAIKFTSDGGMISIKARIINNNLKIEISNEAEEIPLKNRRRLFKPYFQNESSKQSLTGLGLGLALSKSFVELHNGKIWVSRRRPNVNTFGFSIPVNA
jgi:signal transduction histidine kinase